MKAFSALLGLTTFASAEKLAMPTYLTEDNSQPGALSLMLNATSINNLMTVAVPLASYFELNNHTFELGVKEKTFLYELDLDNVHVNDVGTGTPKFEYMDGTDKIHVSFDGVSVDMDVQGKFEALHFIPLEATNIKMKNLKIDFTVESTSTDMVHWQLSDATKVSVEDVEITMKSSALQKLVNLSKKIIDKMINDQMPKIGKMIDSKVQAINKMVANEGPSTFVIPVYETEVGLNLTMTHSPVTKAGSDLIEIFFNGLFTDKAVTQTIADITTYPPRLAHSHSEQVWIHEDMVDSLFQAAGEELFPITINNKDIQAQLLQVFREIGQYYGQDVTIAMDIAMNTGEGKPINFDTKHGVMIGSQSDITSTIELVCSNATTKAETAVTFELNAELHANVTLDNFVIFPKINEIFAANTKVTQDKIGMMSHNYNILFTSILQNTANDINIKYQNGWPMSNIDPSFSMLSGVLKNTTVTPYIAENYLYAGFSMQADLPTLEFTQ